MNWHFRNDRPIYTQLTEQMTQAILSGRFAAGAKLPTVRELAEEAKVNPNTVQRALSELERSGLVYSQRTNGRFVTGDAAALEQARNKAAAEKVSEFLKEMQKFGYDRNAVLHLMQDREEEM